MHDLHGCVDLPGRVWLICRSVVSPVVQTRYDELDSYFHACLPRTPCGGHITIYACDSD